MEIWTNTDVDLKLTTIIIWISWCYRIPDKYFPENEPEMLAKHRRAQSDCNAPMSRPEIWSNTYISSNHFKFSYQIPPITSTFSMTRWHCKQYTIQLCKTNQIENKRKFGRRTSAQWKSRTTVTHFIGQRRQMLDKKISAKFVKFIP